MKQFFYFFISLCFFSLSFAQVQQTPTVKRGPKGMLTDSLKAASQSTSNKGLKNLDAKIKDYLIVSHKNDTTYVDTTLTIQKEYKFNYLRKDNFNLLPFSNTGQTYNTLSQDFYNSNTLPLFGARARHFNYFEVNDINYYRVPTPFTELFYKSVFEQGQVLDAFFTLNTSKQFNVSIAYKGLRSLGKYQHILTSTGNFRFTSNYQTKNKRYQARAHIVMQDLLNEENGGLSNEDILNFESGDEDFLDRSVFDPVFQDAENVLKGKRFYLNHQYNILKKADSTSLHQLSIGNVTSLEDKYYQFNQATQNSFFGDAFVSKNIHDRVTLEDFYAKLFLNYTNKDLGELKLNIGYNNFNYGYDKVVNLANQSIRNRIKDENLAVGGSYKNTIGKLDLFAEMNVNVSGQFEGDFLNTKVAYQLNDQLSFNAQFNSSSKAANYNQLLYQSDYLNYNWDNTNAYKNVNTQQLAFQIKSKNWGNISVDHSVIDNYTYFKQQASDTLVKPFQNDETVKYLRLKLEKDIKFKKFGLYNTIMYQDVLEGEGVFNVPQFITRNTLYYSNHFFKKALFLQTGVTLNYFTAYHMNAYDPLLAEFYVQNETEIGDFPRLDFFINAKIRQTRIYLKAEHFNAAFTGYNYYSAPNYPYRDFAVRFGIVWNFFL